MIIQIFYSLVLFNKINYQEVTSSGYFLDSINEESFGKLELIFKSLSGDEQAIYCKHLDFLDLKVDQSSLISKNWIFSGSNIKLLEYIYNKVIVNEVSDFNFFKDKEYYDSIPFGTVLTITSKCNLFCNYCFNDYDYELRNRNLRKNIGLQKYKRIVDILYRSGTRDIIITGGEPFSCPFLFELLSYIRNQGIFIRINTNGTLLPDKILNKLNRNFCLNLMVSMHEFNNKDYCEINTIGAKNIQGIEGLKSFEKKFEEKVKQLKKIKNYRNISLDFLTILTPKNILYLEQIYSFVLDGFNIGNWHFFRLYSTQTTMGISRNMINLAIHKIYKLNKTYNTNFKIVDSVPFCATKNTELAAQVIDGELSQHHNVKTIITTDGYIQIMSAFDTNLGSIFENDILEVWRGEYVQKMLKNGFLPNECLDCRYKEECRGGSRMDAHIYNKNYSALDPLANISYKETL